MSLLRPLLLAMLLALVPGPGAAGGAPASIPAATPVPPTAAAPDAAGLTLTVQPFFGGTFKYGEWLPLRVLLSNTGPDVAAEARVAVSSDISQVTFAAPVALPTGSQKQVVLYAMVPSYARTVTVEVVRGSDVLKRASADVHPQMNIRYLVGLLAADATPYGSLKGITLEASQSRTVEVAPLTPADIPERPEALRSFDALVLAGSDTAGLGPGQTAALTAWVANGGRLVLAGGPGAERVLAGLPADLRPAGLRRTTLSGLAPFREYAAADTSRVSGEYPAAFPEPAFGRPLLGDASQPLISELRYGQGYITYLAFDPGMSPFTDWAGTRGIWDRLLEPGSAFPPNRPPDASESQIAGQQLSGSLSNLPSLDLPSLRWLAILLGAYILVIGPANYLALRRARRLELAWVTIPSLTLIFAGAAFGIGYRMRGSDVIINQATVVRVAGPNSPALLRSYVGIFSPARSPYNLTIGGDALVGPMTVEPDRFGSPNAANTLTVVQGQPSQLRDLRINQWSMQTFQAERSASRDQWALTGTLGFQGLAASGTLHNGTAYDLTDLVLVVGSQYAKLGDLAAGADMAVTATLQGASNGANGQPPFPYVLFMDVTNGGMTTSASRNGMLKQGMLQTLFGADKTGTQTTNVGATVFGWFSASPIPVELSGSQAGHLNTSLLVVNIPLAVQGNQLALPPGAVPARALSYTNRSGPCGPGARVYVDRGGEAELAYDLPGAATAITAPRLTLYAQADDGGSTGLPVAALYDFKTRAWVDLPALQAGANAAADAARFINPDDASVRLQLRGDNGQGGGCYLFDLGLEGQVQP